MEELRINSKLHRASFVTQHQIISSIASCIKLTNQGMFIQL